MFLYQSGTKCSVTFQKQMLLLREMWLLLKLMTAFGNTKQTQFPLTPVYPPSSLYPSSLQEEARLHPAEYQRDDAPGGAPGDPQHCQRLWMQQCPHVQGPRPLFWHPTHLRGALHQPGIPPPCHDRLQLVLRAPPEANPQDKCQKCNTSTCQEYGRHN